MSSSETPGFPAGGNPPVAPGTNVVAVIGLVAAIVGLLLSWIPGVGLVLSAGGLVLSIVGRKKASQGAGGDGVATGGLVVAIIALLISLLVSACAVMCGVVAHNAQTEMKVQGFDMQKIIEDAKREAEKPEHKRTAPLPPSDPPLSEDQK